MNTHINKYQFSFVSVRSRGLRFTTRAKRAVATRLEQTGYKFRLSVFVKKLRSQKDP